MAVTFSVDKDVCNVGESVIFTIITTGQNRSVQYGISDGEGTYITSATVDGTYNYTYTLTEEGTYTFHLRMYNKSMEEWYSNAIASVTITVIEPPTGSWSINNKEVASLTIGNKEIQSIVRLSDNMMIYKKIPRPSLILTVTGSSFEEYYSSTALRGNDIYVDYGDGTVGPLETKLKHTYTDGLTTHQIEIYNVTSLGNHCFMSCSNLTSITISLGVTSLGINCFYKCSGLTSVTISSRVTSLNSNVFYSCDNLIDYQLYWDSPPAKFNNTIMPNNTNTYYTIPNGTTANYVAKKYPSAKLIERSA